MNAYWCTWQNLPAPPNGNANYMGCVLATDQLDAQAKAGGLVGRVPDTVEPLPHAANPILGPAHGALPMCFDPKRCAGRTSCPKRYACTE